MNQERNYFEMFVIPFILLYHFSDDYTFQYEVYCLFCVNLRVSSQQSSKNSGTNSRATTETLIWEYVGIAKACLNYE